MPFSDTALVAQLRVPTHYLGPVPVPANREARVRHRLAYIEAFGLDPYGLNDRDLEEVVLADHLYRRGYIDRWEYEARLRPLREAQC